MFEVFELGARSFEIAMLKKQLQPPDNGLRTAPKERGDLVGTDEPMPVNESDDGTVTLGQLDGRNGGDAAETG